MDEFDAEDDEDQLQDEDAEAERPPIAADCATAARLVRLSLLSIINESSFPAALLVELALVANAVPRDALAAYAAVVGTTTFAQGVFNFLLTVTMAQVARSVGARRWREVGSRLRIALCTAVAVGACCGLVLLLLEEPLWRLMGPACCAQLPLSHHWTASEPASGRASELQ